MKLGTLEELIRRTANSLGIDIHRYRHQESEGGRLSSLLQNHRVNLVLDVGANAGQFGRKLRRGGYAGRLVSFEPLSSAHAQLMKASHKDRRWEVAPRVALGNRDGTIDIHIANNSVSSSALKMLDAHVDAAPDSRFVGIETAPLARLDTLVCTYLNTETVPFLKIDTQGYEDQVLDGAATTLGKVKGLQLEVSFVALYEGQQLFDAMVKRLQLLGFSIWSIWPGFHDSTSGRMLQADVTFFRN